MGNIIKKVNKIPLYASLCSMLVVNSCSTDQIICDPPLVSIEDYAFQWKINETQLDENSFSAKERDYIDRFNKLPEQRRIEISEEIKNVRKRIYDNKTENYTISNKDIVLWYRTNGSFHFGQPNIQ